jgi:glyoxylase I family protein
MHHMSQPAITGFHHVCIQARKDYAAAVAFYRDVLGLVQKVEFIVDNSRKLSLFDCGGGNYIEVADYSGQAAESKPNTINHIALRTKHVDELLAKVRAAGYKVTVEAVSLELPTTVGPNPYKIRIAFFNGPEGESIELFDEISVV